MTTPKENPLTDLPTTGQPRETRQPGRQGPASAATSLPSAAGAGSRGEFSSGASTPPTAPSDPVSADGAPTVKERLNSAYQSATEAAGTLRVKGGEAAAKAREVAADPANQPKVKGGAAAGAGTAVLSAVVWAIRRRQAQPQTSWEKTMATLTQLMDEAGQRAGQVAQHPTTVQSLTKVKELGETVATHPLTDQAIDRAKDVASTPEARLRAQGAAAALGTLFAVVVLKRAARRDPSSRR